MRYQLTPIRMATPQEKPRKTVEKLEKLEPLCTVGGNVEGYILYGNTIQSIKKLDTELLRDPAVPLLSIHPEELKAGVRREI